MAVENLKRRRRRKWKMWEMCKLNAILWLIDQISDVVRMRLCNVFDHDHRISSRKCCERETCDIDIRQTTTPTTPKWCSSLLSVTKINLAACLVMAFVFSIISMRIDANTMNEWHELCSTISVTQRFFRLWSKLLMMSNTCAHFNEQINGIDLPLPNFQIPRQIE